MPDASSPRQPALQVNVSLCAGMEWLDHYVRVARECKVTQPWLCVLLDAVTGKPVLTVNGGRVEARDRAVPDHVLWSLEPVAREAYPGAVATDLPLRQQGLPGAALQLLRAVPELKVLEVEGFWKWPKVVALTRALYWDKIADDWAPELRAWWARGELIEARLSCTADGVRLDLQAQWSDIEPLRVLPYTLKTVKEQSVTKPTDPVQQLMAAQLAAGLPAFKGSSVQAHLAVDESIVNDLLGALLALARTSSSDAEATTTAPPEPRALAGMVQGVKVSFEPGRAVIDLDVRV